MCSPPTFSLLMTRRSPCSIPAAVAESSTHGVADDDPNLRLRSICSRRTARPSVQPHILQPSRASACRRIRWLRTVGRQGITLAACWSHSRRKFYDVPKPPYRLWQQKPCAGSASSMRSKSASADNRPLTDLSNAGLLQVDALYVLARCSAPPCLRPQHACRSNPLCALSLAWTDALPERWSHRARHQSRRTRDPWSCHLLKKPAANCGSRDAAQSFKVNDIEIAQYLATFRLCLTLCLLAEFARTMRCPAASLTSRTDWARRFDADDKSRPWV
jgi:hypothetical protein